MSLDSNLQTALTRVGTEFKELRILISGSGTGGVGSLDTTATNLVAAINEVMALAEAGGGALDDLSDVTITAGAAGDYVRHNGTAFVDSPLQAADMATATHAATSKASPVDADEVFLVDSEASNGPKRLTLGNLKNVISALIVNSAPTALDTLDELAAALGDDANYAATITTALGNKQAADADLTAIAALTSAADKLPYATGAQAWALTTLTSFARTLLDDTSASDGRTTLSVWSQAEVGPVTTDYVAVFEAALL